MLRPGGCFEITEPDGATRYVETTMCGHCGAHRKIKPSQRPEDIGGFCYGCNRAICPRCVGGGCVPLEKWLEQQEASYHARRSYGLE